MIDDVNEIAYVLSCCRQYKREITVLFRVENSPHDKLGQTQLQVQPIQNSVTEGGELTAPRSGRFAPGQRPVTCCTAGWIDLEVVLEGTVNLDGTGILSPELPVYCGQATEVFLPSLTSTHRHIVWILRVFSPKGRRSGHEAHLLTSSAEAKSKWSFASTKLCAFKVCTRTILSLPVLAKILHYQQHRECKSRLKQGNACYLAVQHL